MENLQNQNQQNNFNQSPQHNPKKQIPSWIGFVIIIIFIAIAFGAVFAYQYLFVKPQPVIQTQVVADQTAGWKTYTNSEYGFELEYPSDFPPDLEKASDEDNVSITFHKVNDPKLHKGFFQVSISSKNAQTGHDLTGYETCDETIFEGKQVGYSCEKECGYGCVIKEINNEKFLYINLVNENYLTYHNDKWFYTRPAFDESSNKRVMSTFKFTK